MTMELLLLNFVRTIDVVEYNKTYKYLLIKMEKLVIWMRDSLKQVKSFPEQVRRDIECLSYLKIWLD